MIVVTRCGSGGTYCRDESRQYVKGGKWNHSLAGQEMTSSSQADLAPLRAIVNRYQVFWGIAPKLLPESMNGNRIGFEIELWGTHDHPADAGKGECFECGRMLDLLEGIAKWIAPRQCESRTTSGDAIDTRTTRHKRNGFGSKISVTLEVLCRNGHLAVSSQCDAGCLFGMKEKLIALGAQRI